MSVRANYKQRLKHLKARVEAERDDLIRECEGKDYDAFREGMRAMCAQVLVWMTADEFPGPAEREPRWREPGEQLVWCSDCKWVGPRKDAELEDGELVCPECAGGNLETRGKVT
jgi:formylmethanofuran dehydrogenase subunit E